MHIKIEDLQITGPEWTIGDLHTLEDYESASAALIDVLIKIESDLASPRAESDPDWKRMATRVRRFRLEAQREVEQRRQVLQIGQDALWNAQFVANCESIDPAMFKVVSDATDGQMFQQAA
jgi:hypothetical protein